jgi:hypothetical protein
MNRIFHREVRPMTDMLRKLKTHAEVAPVHYALVGATIVVSLTVALNRIF